MRSALFITTLSLTLAWGQVAQAQDASDIRSEQQDLQQQARQSQSRIEDLDDETMSLVATYNRELERYEELLTYNENMRQLLASQEQERQRINQELQEMATAQDGPSPAVAQRILRIIERSGDDTQQMFDDLERLATTRGIRDRDRGFIRREQAALLIREERMAEATELLSTALENRAPDYVPSLRLFLGQLLLMENRPEPAIEQLQLWSEHVVDPRPSELSILGYAYLQLEQFSAAVDLFERVLASAEVINDQWYDVLAYAYIQNGQSDTAIELLDRVIAEQPDESRWW